MLPPAFYCFKEKSTKCGGGAAARAGVEKNKDGAVCIQVAAVN